MFHAVFSVFQAVHVKDPLQPQRSQVLWDDPGFVAARGADLRVYYDAGQFQAKHLDARISSEVPAR